MNPAESSPAGTADRDGRSESTAHTALCVPQSLRDRNDRVETMQDPTSATLKTCSIAMRFDAADLPKALELLLSAVGPTRAKHGCRSCHVDRDAIEPDRVRYEEEWDSGEALMRHVRSQDFLFVLLALDLCREEPEVRVADLSAQRGMGVLRNLRESGPGVGRDQARVRPHPRPA